MKPLERAMGWIFGCWMLGALACGISKPAALAGGTGGAAPGTDGSGGADGTDATGGSGGAPGISGTGGGTTAGTGGGTAIGGAAGVGLAEGLQYDGTILLVRVAP